MSHLPLDARAILHYLNELGYRNISAIQLKEFLKDLRKLIKYEECMGVNNQQNDYYESLFRRTTASYRAKIDRENNKEAPAKRRPFTIEPSCGSKQAAAKNRKVLSERNNGETSYSSNDLLNSVRSSKSSPAEKIEKAPTDRRNIKALIEKILAHVLHDKYSQEFVDKDQENLFKEKSPIKSMIEKILKEKLHDLRHPIEYKQSLSSSEPGSLKSIIVGIINEVLEEKFSNISKESKPTESYIEEVKNLNQDLQQKLTISHKQDNVLPREPVTHYNNIRPLDSQSLVTQLLSPENGENKNLIKSKTDKENSKTPTKAGSIKRLQRAPRKKPEWQDPKLQDTILEKPAKAIRSQSPAISSSARSGRSSSVLIRRSKTQGRKPTSDPVALYQYYKNEWEHFRNQIPGESSHDRLRWHVRQRLLDPK